MTLDGSSPAQRGDYEASWSSLKKRDQLVWLIAVSFVPCMAALMISITVTGSQVAPQVFLYAAAMWLIAYAAASRYRQEFRCPRCAQRFFPRGREVQGCPACGLPLWSPGSGDAFDTQEGASTS